MTSDKYIKFIKEKLEKLPFNSGWWFASNMEGLCIRCGKKKKTYHAHWSVPTINKDGYTSRKGIRKKLGGFHIPLEEIKKALRSNIDDYKKLSNSSESSLTVGGLVSSFIKSGVSGLRIRQRGERLSYKPKTTKGYIQTLNRSVLLKSKKSKQDQIELKQNMDKVPVNYQGFDYTGALKDVPLQDVSRRDIEIWMTRLKATPIAANHALAALSVAFEFDMQKGKDRLYSGSNNPCIRVTKYAVNKDKKYLHVEKVIEIRDYIVENQWRDPHFLTYYMLLLECGERQSDLSGLYRKAPTNPIIEKDKGCTGWLDLENESIHLLDSKDRHEHDVPLTEEAIAILKQLEVMLGDRLSKYIKSKFVFPQSYDEKNPDKIHMPITENSFRFKMDRFHYKFGLAERIFIRASKGKYGKKRVLYKYKNIFTLKHLRKTFVTHFGREEGLEAASLRMRHSSLKVTQDHYFNADKDKLRKKHMYSKSIRQSRSAIKPRAIIGGKYEK